jgi:hypothetical protein
VGNKVIFVHAVIITTVCRGREESNVRVVAVVTSTRSQTAGVWFTQKATERKSLAGPGLLPPCSAGPGRLDLDLDLDPQPSAPRQKGANYWGWGYAKLR